MKTKHTHTHTGTVAHFLITKNDSLFARPFYFMHHYLFSLPHFGASHLLCLSFLTHPGSYPLYCVPVEPNHPLAHQTGNLLTGIAMATRQDEDGDTYVVVFQMAQLGS